MGTADACVAETQNTVQLNIAKSIIHRLLLLLLTQYGRTASAVASATTHVRRAPPLLRQSRYIPAFQRPSLRFPNRPLLDPVVATEIYTGYAVAS